MNFFCIFHLKEAKFQKNSLMREKFTQKFGGFKKKYYLCTVK